MTIKAVTSLADLEFKAKTNKRYQQLAVMGCRSIEWGLRKNVAYTTAMEKLHKFSIENDPESCDYVVDIINRNRHRIKVEKSINKKKSVTDFVEVLKKLSKKRKVKQKARRPSRRTV